ncbi:HypC/HybG/HupF family hydrogenase formation chaperone [Sutterella faecalis]|uniref:HypC/HybG/HupF family hydrogenase formation chaperone n=2 Tax=Sutterella TaxID=40544 RepID=A0AAI9SB37_9BURK|nr:MULTISPECIES: HypC/HybG/HupF family hydrogenase formation chaperone [Sutterella]KAB7650714.1 HypC/HybG/HupF family hydrogenase formation chaperone [Sutterella seckii]MBE5691380.1 HypC/HybG/HupF family hydrogenase formation chaperone [Sutterella sp.]QDA55666.1 HypC/HybG/HupF family hydrogenase formation chaperone [Sutterella faecalis]
MCLAVPAEILSVSPNGADAMASIGGIEKPVDVSLIDHPVPGDWVIVHVGFALNRIDAKEAEETLRILASAGELHEGMTITSGGARP